MKTLLILLALVLTCAIAPAQKVMRDYVRIVYGGDTLDIKLSGDSVVLITNQKILKFRKDFSSKTIKAGSGKDSLVILSDGKLKYYHSAILKLSTDTSGGINSTSKVIATDTIRTTKAIKAPIIFQGTDSVPSCRAMAADTVGLTPNKRYEEFIDASGNIYKAKSNKRGGWVKLNYILPLFFFFKRKKPHPALPNREGLFIFLLFLFLPFLLNAQKIAWPQGGLGMIKMPITADTVVYSPPGIESHTCDCTFYLNFLTAPVKVTFGGSEIILNSTYEIPAFQAFQNDSLPVTISNTALRDTTNAQGGRIGTNIKTIPILSKINHEKLGIRVWKLTNTGNLFFKCIFVK